LAAKNFTLPHEIRPPLTMRALCQRLGCVQPIDRIEIFEKEAFLPRVGRSAKLPPAADFAGAFTSP
jgi:hypothetical protein